MSSKNFFLLKSIPSFFLAIIFFVASQGCSNNYVQKNVLRIHCIDVGYGSSIFIEFPDMSAVLIDAGEKYYAAQLVNYLSSLKVAGIDKAIITHPHKNHFEGFFDVLDLYSVKRLFTNGDNNAEEGYEELLAKFREKSIPAKELKRGDQIEGLPDSISIEILNSQQASRSANDNSLVLWLTYKEFSILFTSDMGIEMQSELIKSYDEIASADVVQIPHHGGPIGGDFISAFKDKTFILSTGENQWGLPKEDEIQKLGGMVFRTDKHKTIVIESDGNSVSVKTSHLTRNNNI